jgi:uncharacterized protein YbjT (DUF2867 family)
MNYLITGATGKVGSLVVKGLLDRGERPRVFVRDRSKAKQLFADRVDIAHGDLADAASLRSALEGIDGLLLVNVGSDLAARDAGAAEAAKSARVRRIVKLSSMDAANERAVGAWHARGEAAIRVSGVPFTFVRPAGFMSNALSWAASIRTEGVVRTSAGDGRVAFVHPQDIADVATATLIEPQYEGRTLSLTGPEALSYAEMTAQIGATIGRPVRFEAISDEAAEARLLASGAPPAVARALVELWRAVREGELDALTNDVERVLLRKPASFAQWVEQNASAFIHSAPLATTPR